MKNLSTPSVMLLAVLAGCAHITGEAYVPDDAVLAVGVPHIGRALSGMKAAEDRFAETEVVRKSRAAVHDPLLAETGIDLDHPETLSVRGLDPERDLYISTAALSRTGTTTPTLSSAAMLM